MSRTPSPSSSSGEPSRAGSRPGEGRARPGRREVPEDDPRATGGQLRRDERGRAGDGTGRPDVAGVGVLSGRPHLGDGGTVTVPLTPEAVPVPSAPSRTAAPHAVAGAENAAEPLLRILPLGSGLVLIGIGLGLAFVALRMRQSGGLP